GCGGFLLDTYVKDGRTLLDWLDPGELICLRRRALEQGLAFAVAGSLRADALPQLECVRPDIVAIRSAACTGGVRSAGVAADLVRQFKNRMELAWPTAARCD